MKQEARAEVTNLVKPLLLGVLVTVLLVGCRDDGVARPDPAAQAACEARGGSYNIAGILGEYSCIEPTPDAGKSCSKDQECSGFCLAGSRSCSPITPLFGCHRILMEDGSPVEICID